MTFSLDGSLLASATVSTVRLWDVAKRAEVGTLAGHGVAYRRNNSLSFSPAGRLLASLYGETGGVYDRRIRLWDVATQKLIATLDHGRLPPPSSVVFSPDGTTLASGHRAWHRTVALWDVETREQVAILEREGSGAVTSVAFSPDGRLLASAGGVFNNTIRLWDVLTRQELVAFGHTDPFYSVAFSPDGTLLAAGSEGIITLWDVSKWTGPRPSAIDIILGDVRQGAPGDVMAEPFVILVRDQNGNPVDGIVVDFKVIAGGGTLSVTTATTDENGRAATTLTLGSQPGTNTVVATVQDLEPVTFTAIATARADFDGDGTVGFGDFVQFAGLFGSSQGDEGYDARFDLDGNGAIGFSDFLIFAGAFGKG